MDLDEGVRKAWESLKKKTPPEKEKKPGKNWKKEAGDGKKAKKDGLEEKNEKKEDKEDKKEDSEEKTDEGGRAESIERMLSNGDFQGKAPEPERFALRTAAPRQAARAFFVGGEEGKSEEISYEAKGKYSNAPEEEKEERGKYSAPQRAFDVGLDAQDVIRERTFFEKTPAAASPDMLGRKDSQIEKGLYSAVDARRQDYDFRKQQKSEEARKYKAVKALK